MDLDLDGYIVSKVHSHSASTHMRDVPLQLGAETVGEAREQASTTGEDDVPEEDLTDVRVACAQRR